MSMYWRPPLLLTALPVRPTPNRAQDKPPGHLMWEEPSGNVHQSEGRVDLFFVPHARGIHVSMETKSNLWSNQ